MSEKICVYISGPMFSAGDLQMQKDIATILENTGYATYLPERDGLEVGKAMKMLNNPLTALVSHKVMVLVMKAVFALDVYQVIKRCPLLVFNADGAVPDPGSVSETAMAFALGKPTVIYKNDPRSQFNGFDNPLVGGLSYTWNYTDTMAEIPKRLQSIIDTLKELDQYPLEPFTPPFQKKTVEFGEKIWEVLQWFRSFEENMELKEKDIWKFLEKFIEKLEKDVGFPA